MKFRCAFQLNHTCRLHGWVALFRGCERLRPSEDKERCKEMCGGGQRRYGLAKVNVISVCIKRA